MKRGPSTRAAFWLHVGKGGGRSSVLFQSYKPIDGTYDELIDTDGVPRPAARRAVRILDRLSPGEFGKAQSLAELSLTTRA